MDGASEPNATAEALAAVAWPVVVCRMRQPFQSIYSQQLSSAEREALPDQKGKEK